MNATYENYRYYRKARRKFALTTYLLLLLWLILAIIQWAVVCLIENARGIFWTHYYICFVTFILAVLLFAIFIFVEKLRFIKVLNFIVALIIVELQIISLFVLVARTFWLDLVVFYVICFVVLWLFILIGTFLPRKVDLTLDVAILFIVGFIFLIISVYFLMFTYLVYHVSMYAYIVVEVAISIIVLFFVMYHAQTINGNRFAEMRLNDAILGSLILFHDFLIIYWLTFYWQILARPFTPDYWLWFSTLRDDDLTHTTSLYDDSEDYTTNTITTSSKEPVARPSKKNRDGDDDDEGNNQNRPAGRSPWRSRGRGHDQDRDQDEDYGRDRGRGQDYGQGRDQGRDRGHSDEIDDEQDYGTDERQFQGPFKTKSLFSRKYKDPANDDRGPWRTHNVGDWDNSNRDLIAEMEVDAERDISAVDGTRYFGAKAEDNPEETARSHAMIHPEEEGIAEIPEANVLPAKADKDAITGEGVFNDEEVKNDPRESVQPADKIEGVEKSLPEVVADVPVTASDEAGVTIDQLSSADVAVVNGEGLDGVAGDHVASSAFHKAVLL